VLSYLAFVLHVELDSMAKSLASTPPMVRVVIVNDVLPLCANDASSADGSTRPESARQQALIEPPTGGSVSSSRPGDRDGKLG
jgi:hypothetical protein